MCPFASLLLVAILVSSCRSLMYEMPVDAELGNPHVRWGDGILVEISELGSTVQNFHIREPLQMFIVCGLINIHDVLSMYSHRNLTYAVIEFCPRTHQSPENYANANI